MTAVTGNKISNLHHDKAAKSRDKTAKVRDTPRFWASSAKN